MQGDLRISPYSAPCGSCPEKGCGAKHTTCEAYIAFRKKADKYKRDKSRRQWRATPLHGAVCGRCTMRTAQSAKGGNITDEHAAIRLVGLCKMDDPQL